MTSPVLFETKNDCLDVILNRPDEGNLITNEMGGEIARVLRELGPEIKLIRLRGNGANFCKGRQAPKIDRDTMTPLQTAPPDRRGAAGALRRGEGGARADARDRAGRGDRRRLRARRGLRHDARRRRRGVPGAGAQPQHRADAGDVGAAQPRAVQDRRLSGLFARAHHRASARSSSASSPRWSRRRSSRAKRRRCRRACSAARATSLQGIKEFLKFASRMDPASASAYSATLNAAVTASAPREPHR